MDILTFIFGSFWRWAGTVVLVLTVGASITPMITIKHVRPEGGDND